MRGEERAIRDAGATLAVIGSGSPFMARAFQEDSGLDAPVYVDPGLGVFEAAGMKRGLTSLLHPKAALRAASALRAGHRQGRTQGDPLQQGGILVVRPPGEITYTYRSAFAGDHPPPSEIRRAAEAAAG